MSNAILFDCDDVLLDWIGGFKTFASEHLGREVCDEPQSWQMGSWLGTTDAVALELVAEFNASPAFGHLKAVAGAQSIVSDMKADGEFRLHVISSCSSDPATVTLRRLNLERVFGADVFDSVHCLDLGQSKLKVLQAWAPGALWIEDNYKNALLGLQVGHSCLIRERPHNREYRQLIEPRLTWFTQWSELGETI